MTIPAIPPGEFSLVIEYSSKYGGIFAHIPVWDDDGSECGERPITFWGQAQFGSHGQVQIARFPIAGAMSLGEAIAGWPQAVSAFLKERAEQERKIVIAPSLPETKQ